MAKEVSGSKIIVAQDHPNNHVSGSKMYRLTAELRRKGYTVHFGADRDPKKTHCS